MGKELNKGLVKAIKGFNNIENLEDLISKMSVMRKALLTSYSELMMLSAMGKEIDEDKVMKLASVNDWFSQMDKLFIQDVRINRLLKIEENEGSNDFMKFLKEKKGTVKNVVQKLK